MYLTHFFNLRNQQLLQTIIILLTQLFINFIQIQTIFPVQTMNNNQASPTLDKAPQNQEPIAQNKSKLQSKKYFEYLWKSMFVFIIVVFGVLVNKIYLYQTLQLFQPIRKGNVWELFVYGIPFGAIFLGLETLAHRKFDNFFNDNYLSFQRYKTEESRKKRCYTLVKWAFSLAYYAVFSIAAFALLKETSFMPTWLGGNGYCTDATRYITSFEEANQAMKIYYVFQFGKHLSRFFQHVFIRSEGNFYEYALHHGLSTFLIFFSYLMNMWLIGIFVLLIHDFSDFFLILGRGYRDFKFYNKIVINWIYYIGGFFWVFCRIYLLCHCCVYSSLSSAYKFWLEKQSFGNVFFQVYFLPGIFMGFMLSSLAVLQVFWTYYIARAFIEVGISSKITKHNYD